MTVKTGRIHADHAGDARNHGFHAGHEPADKDALATMSLEESYTLIHQASVARQRPNLADLVLVEMAEPIGDGIARGRAEHSPNENRKGIELAEADEGTCANQNHSARDDQPD